ncbi:hypothetical protein [Rhizobium leguminosarum]|uniref:hypothetical protein n=1 Tax=Rhizobium leguminosarum TaxID=384 RepID=UPI003F9A30EA
MTPLYLWRQFDVTSERKRRSFFNIAIAVVITAWGSNGLAQDIANAHPQNAALDESFDPTAAVSGGVVVGLRIGEATGKLVVDNVQVVGASQSTVCVRAVTRDGRFSSNNKYVVQGASRAARLRLLPITTHYSKILSDYDSSDYALKVFAAAGNDCLPKDALNLPQIVPDASSRDVLTLLINSSSRRVSLEDVPGAPAARCNPISAGARIAFDHECRLDIAKLPSGPVKLTVDLDDGFAVEREDIRVALPEKAP